MHILCPNCQDVIELAKLSSDQITCSACGSSFRLEQESTTGWDPAQSRQRVGKFELLDVVGMGSFGTVYQARDTELDRVVAIKVPRAGSLGGSSGAADRFLREARSVAQLRHPSIVPVYEAGQHEGVPYLVCEFVQGVTLSDRLTGERFSARQAADLVAAVADALQYAHEHGVVHRDVKPSNIMLDEEGRPHVMDFGLAKRDAGEVTVTLEGQVLGTPAYMSPEQARGEGHTVDGRSDVYSLGVILYQLLTGRLPFKGNQRLLLNQVLHDEPPPPRKVDAGVPRDLETVCLKAMAKEPGKRYASARELADDLRRYLKGEPIKARRARAWERVAKWVRRRPAAAVAVALAVLLPLGAASLGLWYWDAHYRVKVEYYAEIVKRWGIPEGIGRVTEAEARHRQVTYKFYRRGGRVERVEAVNGSGALTTRHDLAAALSDALPRSPGLDTRGESRWEYSRTEKGEVTEEVARDRAGGIVWIFHYTTRTTGQFTDEKGIPRPRAASGAAFIEFTRSADGLDREIHYLDRSGRRKPDRDGIAGKRWEYDERARTVAETYLGLRDQPVRNAEGFARVQMSYDDRGNVIERAFFDPDGHLTLTRSGYARLVLEHDAYGNTTRQRTFGLDGKPAPDGDGIVETRWAFDDHGNRIGSDYFGPDGQAALNKYGTAGITIVYDERADQVSWTHRGLDGKPAPDKQGIVSCKLVHDDAGNILEYAYFGLDGNPVQTPTGFARCTMVYDEHSNRIEQAYWGADGKPADSFGGFAKYRAVFDEHGNPTEIGFSGADGKPALNKFTGTARTTLRYDDRGNVTERAYYGTDGRPIPDRDGIARDTQVFDENGNLVEEACFGIDGKPSAGRIGFSRATFQYDQDGTLIGAMYFGPDGNPVRTQVVVGQHYSPALARDDGLDLQPGDVVVAYDEKEFASARWFVTWWRREATGRPGELRLLRNGKPLTVRVPPGQAEWVWNFLETRGLPGGP